jgi:hypothetical protein
MQGGISRNSPNRRRPRESPRGSNRPGNGEGLRPRAVTRNGVWRGLPRRISGRAGRFRPERFSKGDRRGFGLDASPKGSESGISVAPERPDGDRRRAFEPLRRDPPGPERGRQSSLRDPGEAAGLSSPGADPKPPSERWPRHPATAVKAGTSGGRWRRRPPLLFGSKRYLDPEKALRGTWLWAGRRSA